MELGIFIGGIFLGLILGSVVMALVGVASLPSKPEKRQLSGEILPASALSPPRLAPALRARPQVSGAWFTPWRGGGPRLGSRVW